jgi:hypothetical protein
MQTDAKHQHNPHASPRRTYPAGRAAIGACAVPRLRVVLHVAQAGPYRYVPGTPPCAVGRRAVIDA